jgi:hypothetical protein
MRRHQRVKAHADQLRAAAKNQLATKPEVGREYTVKGYWTGTFKARVEWISASEGDPLVRLVVTDAMRRTAAIACEFPECVDEMDHQGPHTFDEDFRVGTRLELAVRNARFLPVVFEQFQKRDEGESWQQGKHV